MAGQKIGTARAVRRRENAVLLRFAPEMGAEAIEELPRRVRPLIERRDEVADPHVVVAELFLACVGVVDAIDAVVGERGVVYPGRADVMVAPARLVQVVIEVGARRHQAVDITVLDQVRHDHPETARAERAGHPHEDRDVVLEHLLPDTVCDAEGAPLERNALHLFEKLVCLRLWIDGEGLDRHLQEAGALFHA